ncbi:MAG: 50S ribosomal protein L11 methyltransferase [Litorimonas sp.]
MTTPFALTIRAPRDVGYDLAEQLGFDEMKEALAVSIFDENDNAVSIQALYEIEATAKAAQIEIPAHLECTIAQLPDEDWVGLSQSGLPPIKAGRFFVHGSHDTPSDDAVFTVLVDAGQAFGTGHHGTTTGCLLMLDELEAQGLRPDTILDLGTGAGILAIAAAKLFPAADILATDIDPVATQVADANAAINAVQFRSVTADGFETPSLQCQFFDLIIANILAGPLRGLAADIAQAMNTKGFAILSGILDEQAEWVAEAFRAEGLTVEVKPSLEGWTSLLASRN